MHIVLLLRRAIPERLIGKDVKEHGKEPLNRSDVPSKESAWEKEVKGSEGGG